MSMRVLIMVALLGALVTAKNADAALCIRLSAQPTRPTVGHRIAVVMKTFVPTASGTLNPSIVRDYPFRAEAVSPRGRTFRIKVAPSRDPYAWRGTFRFSTVGVWRIRVTNFPGYPAGCGEQLLVRVRAG